MPRPSPRNIAGAEAVGLPSLLFDVARPAAANDQARHMLGLPAPHNPGTSSSRLEPP